MQNTVTKTIKPSVKKLFSGKRNNNLLIFQSIEKKLNKIFADEMDSSDSIFKYVSSNAIHKMALFLSGAKGRACSIGIAGETASGKSTITLDIIDTIEDYTEKLARSLHVKGMINIQFIVCDGKVYVIEVNPRSSRTVPYISKVTGIPIVKLATKCIIGHTLKEMGYKPGLQPNADYIAIKMPVFSFEKIRGAETSLGPEMKSTGECLGIAKTFNEALYKAFLGAGVVLPKHKKIIISVKDADKQEVVPLAQRFEKLGYEVYATRSTADVLRENGVDAIKVNKIHQEAPTVMDLLLEHKIDIVIDTPTQGRDKNRDGFLIRRTSIETGVNCFTSLDTVDALLTSLESDAKENLTLVDIATL